MSTILNNNPSLESKLENNLERKLEAGLIEDEAMLLNRNQGLNSGLNSGLNTNTGLGLNQGLGLNNTTGLNSGLGLNQGLAGLNTSTGLASGAYVQSGQRSSLGLVRAEPAIIETIQKDVVIQERIHPVMKEEIQPVIYREREQLDVKQVTQMMHETQIQPTIIQQRELPAERREAIIERAAPIAENFIAPSTVVDATLRSQVVHAPIINEVIKKTIIEEIQPVLERDIITSTVIQNTQPIYEKIVEAPIVSRETVILQQDRGIVGGSLEALAAQGFNIGETGRRLSQNYGNNLNLGLNQGLTTAPLGQTYATPLAGETLANTGFVNTAGNRRSLTEALPASYSYLGADQKLAEAQLLNNNVGLNSNLNNAALPAKTVL